MRINHLIRVTLVSVIVAAMAQPGFGQRVPTSAAQGVKKLLETVLKVVGVVSAAKAAEEAGISVQNYWKDTAPPGESIYSASFHFDKKSWADFWTGPDIFMVVEYEGATSVLIPDIENNWNGQNKIYTFRCRTMPTGSRCVLRLCDDDSTSNAVWNSLLSAKFRWQVGATARTDGWPKQGVQTLEATARTDGAFQILDAADGKQYQIDVPDAVATATFIVPTASPSDRWDMDGSFLDGSTEMGRVHLTHWYTNEGHRFLSFLNPSLLFWIVLAVGAFAILRWRQARPQAI